jgi:hypothetical protein
VQLAEIHMERDIWKLDYRELERSYIALKLEYALWKEEVRRI